VLVAGLVDEHQAGGVKQTMLSHSASAFARDFCALLLRRVQSLFEADVASIGEPPRPRLRLPAIPRYFIGRNHLVERQIARQSDPAETPHAPPSGEVLPPTRLCGSSLLKTLCANDHHTGGLTHSVWAASRRDTPVNSRTQVAKIRCRHYPPNPEAHKFAH
jgi:hypothetical protein